MTRREQDARAADRLWAGYTRSHDPQTRDALVHQFERLAYSIANRFVGRGIENEDLYQVAMLGLVKAVDRFEPRSGHRFTSFAAPTILGEIRRHFRDCSWTIHVPRRLQERAVRARRRREQLEGELGRTPTIAQLAARLEMTEEEVLELLAVEEANRPRSLDGVFEGTDGETRSTLTSLLGAEDAALQRSEDQVSIEQAFRYLPRSLRDLLHMRYQEELTLREVGSRLGISAMQVHRLEKRALSLLRQQFAHA